MNSFSIVKKIFAFLLLLEASMRFLVSASADDNLILAKDGKAQYGIVLSANAIPAEKTAADELKKYLDLITGAVFAIQSEEKADPHANQIVVGPGPRAKSLLSGFDWTQVGNDGIVLKSGGNWIVLAGDRPRGTLYAVYEFLENSAGVRWWTVNEKTVPSQSTLSVPAQNLVYTSPFSYREHFTTETYKDRGDPIFSTILRENGDNQTQTEAWGDHYTILGSVHTFPLLMPTEKYFKDHPEWYSDPANKSLPCTADSKMPNAAATQLCFTAPSLVEEVTKNALDWISKNPHAGYISLSQADGAPFCRDPASEEIFGREGSQAGVLIDFVNKVAKGIHEKYPAIKVETLAYLETENPPKTVRPGPNVLIRLAPLHADFGHTLDSDWNRKTRDNFNRWAAIAPELFAWYYSNNFDDCLMPNPDWNTLGANLRFFAAHHVKGVFEEANVYTDNAGDFIELRTWIFGKLLWNPQLDQKALTDTFLNGYYGPAAFYLKQYLDLIENSFLAQNRRLSTFNHDFSFLDLTTMNQATRLFDQAAAAAKDDPVLKERIGRVRMSLDMAWLKNYKALKLEAQGSKEHFLGPNDLEQGIADFLKTAAHYDVNTEGEQASLDQRLDVIRKE